MTATPSSRVAGLFERHDHLRAVVESVLEGRQGSVTDRGKAARLSLGCYELFAGDPTSSEARDLVAGAARPRELIYGNDPEWRRLILEVYGERVVDRPMTEFDPGWLDLAALAAYATAPSEAYQIRALNEELASQLDAELEPHGLQAFDSPANFVARGLGFGAMAEGRLVSAATSYARSAGLVEVAIATRPTYRGQGLATAVGAALLARCLERGLRPRWSAANPTSKRLAERLGFRPAGECEVLFLA